MRWTRLGLLALFLLAFALRVYRLDFQSIWVDEGFVVDLASRSFQELVSVWSISPQEGYASLSRLGVDLTGLAAETDIHPPLYYFLIHFWLPLAGRSEFALRFLSVFFGSLTIPLVFILGKRLVNSRVAFLASAISALSPFYLDFSQQVRMYTLVTFLAVLSMYSFYRAFEDRRRIYLVVYALSTALALYTHYFAITVVLVQAVLIVARATRNREPARLLGLWLATQSGAALLLLPWVPFALRQVFNYQNRSLLSPDWQTVLPRTWQAFNLGLAVDGNQMAPLLVVLLAVLLVGLALAWWRFASARPGLAALLLYLALPLLVGLVIFRFKPMFHPKYFMMASPAYYLLLGAAVYGIWRHLRWAAVPVGLFLFAALSYASVSYFFDARYWKDDTRAVARYLEAKATSQDLVLSDLMEPLGYYYGGEAPAYYLPGDESSVPDRLASLARDRGRVFLVHYEHSYTDAQGLIPFLLEREGDKLDDKGFRGYSLREYQLNPGAGFALAAEPPSPGANFEGKLALEGWRVGAGGSGEPLTPPMVPSGGRIWATLAWRLMTPGAADYRASIYLTDGRGHVAAQNDSPILRGMDSTSRWLPGEGARNYYTIPIFRGVAPGEYGLHLRVYATSQSHGQGTSSPSLRYLGDEVDLGKVSVTSPLRPVEFSAQDMDTPSTVQMGPIEGLGYTLTRRQYRPGDVLPLALFLRASQVPDRDYQFRFELRDNQGVQRWQWESPPVYPTSRWKKGDGVRDWQDLPLTGRLSPGEYHLWIGLSPAGLLWDLGSIQVLDRPRSFAPPLISHPLRAELEGKLALLGYDLEGELRPGSAFKLTLYWQALAPVDESYTVFAHLLDGQNRIWAQHDGVPAGDSPTSGWREGEVVTDRHVLTIRADASPGEYALEVGMYDARSGRRVAVSSTQARVVDQALRLGEVQVR
ncbi:MAG: glycosyltransferase family 39 protein [Dehalococcoidia bacterium]|nr:glycosyltransferase family 39 protein [Dehalococcoidia bacterium]